MVDIQSVTADIRRGIKKKEEERNHRTKNVMTTSAMQHGHNKAALPPHTGSSIVFAWWR